MKAKLGFLFVVLTVALGMIACSDSEKKAATTAQPGVEDAVKTAVDAYVYGYPLVTMDMTRKQFTNVAAPDAAHAPMGQILRFRTYPAVDNHTVTAPNADTLYTSAWFDRFERAVDSQRSRHGRPLLPAADAGRMDRCVPGSR